MAEDNQARTVKVGKWLYDNRDKAGTPEYETAVSAYKKLKSKGTQSPAPSWSDVPVEAAKNAPASLGKLAGDTLRGAADVIQHPLATVKGLSDTANGLVLNIPGAQQFNQWASDVGIAPKYTPEAKAADAQDAAAGAEIIARKKQEYGTSEAFVTS